MTGPDLKTALEWLAEGGLPRDRRMPTTPERDALAREFRAAANAYPRVLQAILDMSLFRSPVDHRLTGQEYYRYAQMREGQNQLAAAILDYIAHAQTLERQDVHERSTPSEPGAGPGGSDPSGDNWLAGGAASPFVAVTG